ncbi:methylated-DNA--[protein]-cysteine S-methyltransferase [Staphylococcus edaphicus]|uniref:methylated-DNA--[protein]-cysteine S-methyltransferase n=1 Tax=Staphylococcus edaphicus TaxID=1955013 RepID=A0A2C6WJA5_9STAP|nr:methylated-DNA--[protein]-cysteine S-methyltransferase [Staphylococcus edaphicus]PHK49180.1 cysteine methyltransferase [Staphylococcus edaphicus]UQW80549.1 methylated-DNA--[protein]-cysteine S-methyltransferase [Staphylococcus edaphicus]
MKKVYYDHFIYQGKAIYVYVSDNGLVFVSSLDEPNEIHMYIHNIDIVQNNAKTSYFINSIKAYLNHGQVCQNIELDLGDATDFQKRVWRTLLTVPYGNTATYTEIAQHINQPTAVRAVANAIGKNPFLIVVPCHKIIGKNGDLRGFRAGLTLKQHLLNLEHNSTTNSSAV